MNENYNIEDKDWERIAKKFYDSGSEPTGEKIADSSEPANIKGLVNKVNLYFELKKYQTDEAWDKVEAQMRSASAGKQSLVRRLYANPLYRYAAAVIIAATLLVTGYEYVYRDAEILKEVTSTSEVLKAFTLPDGTKVSLNSNSSVSYPEQFGPDSREVNIQGEVFFEVKPDRSKPFIIHTKQAQVKVLGTSFSVSAYPQSSMVEVIVETGKVQFTNKNNESTSAGKLILTPGEKGILDVSSNSLQKTSNQNLNYIAWKTRTLIFKATSLGEVIKDLESVYKVDIRLADPELNNLRLTAQFNDYSLDFILKVIESTFNMEVRNMNGQFLLKAKS
jgi:ferric-dicitrate binding protein FerR (iron transport regulator)